MPRETKNVPVSVKLDTALGTRRAARTFIWGSHWPAIAKSAIPGPCRRAEGRKPIILKGRSVPKATEPKRSPSRSRSEAMLYDAGLQPAQQSTMSVSPSSIRSGVKLVFFFFFKKQTIGV